MGKNTASQKTTIKADVATVYALLEDVENYPQWMDEFKEAEVTERTDDGHPAKSRFVLSSMGVTMEMLLAYEHTDTSISWSLIEGKMMQKNDGAYRLTDNGDGTTELTYELDTETSVPLPGMVQRKLTKKVVNDTLKAVKKHAEA